MAPNRKTTPPGNGSSSSPLLSLPQELRDMIYEWVVGPEPVCKHRPPAFRPRPARPSGMSKEDFARSARISLTRPPPRRRKGPPKWQNGGPALLLVNKQLSAEYMSFVGRRAMHQFFITSYNAQLVPFWNLSQTFKSQVRKCQIVVSFMAMYYHHRGRFSNERDKARADLRAQTPGLLDRIKNLAQSMPNVTELKLLYVTDMRDSYTEFQANAAWDLSSSLKTLPALRIFSIHTQCDMSVGGLISEYQKTGAVWTGVERQTTCDLWTEFHSYELFDRHR